MQGDASSSVASNQGAPYAATGVRDGVDHVSRRAFTGARADAGIGSGEGTSRAQGRGTPGGRFEEGDTTSDSD